MTDLKTPAKPNGKTNGTRRPLGDDDAMLGALGAVTDLPADVRRTLGLSDAPTRPTVAAAVAADVLEDDVPEEDAADDGALAETPARLPVGREVEPPAKRRGGPTFKPAAFKPASPKSVAPKLGTAGRLRVDVEALRRDSTHQLGHVIDEAIAFRLKRAAFEQKLTRGPWRTERSVLESALTDWLDRYEAGELEPAA